VRIRAILNPRAGLGSRRAREALDRTHPVWGRVEVCETDSPGHARELAREAAEGGADAVLAVGGDGTANEVAQGLVHTRTALGLVPVGSGNGLARALGIPLAPARALAALADAVPKAMDVGRVNGRLFLNLAGAGLDAEVGAEFHSHGRKGGRRGLWTYVRLTLRRALSYEARPFRLEAGASVFEGRALIVAFVNGRQYGGGAIVTPRARLDDGLLDVVVFEEAPFLEIALQVPRLFLGRIEGFRGYRLFQTAGATLTAAHPFLHHRDGEPEPAEGRLDVSIDRKALRILVPLGTALDPRGPFETGPAGA
jgi:YegS/Rv2252/BmrU family lipid kinase